jgi:hypothetical protein
MTILLFLLANGQSGEAAADRFQAFMRATPAFSVDVRHERDRVPSAAVGKLLVRRPANIRYETEWMGERFVYGIAGGMRTELDVTRGLYELTPVDRIFFPDGNIAAGLSGTLPRPLVTGSLRDLLPPGTRFDLAETEGLPAGVEEIRARYETDRGAESIIARIDGQGRLLRIEHQLGAPPNALKSVWIMQNFRPREELADRDFGVELRPGMVPNVLPREPVPLAQGEIAPRDGWIDLATGHAAPISAGTPILLLLVDDASPSRRLLADRGRFSELMKRHGGEVVAAAGVATKEQARLLPQPVRFDPTGKLVQRLSPAAFPAYYLLDGEGRILRLWMGYSPALAREIERELDQVLREAAETP